MKKFLLPILLCAFVLSNAQTTLFTEYFTGSVLKQLPPDWYASSNTDVHEYIRPFVCAQIDSGLMTPAVGKDAPSRIVLPEMTYYTVSGNTLAFSFKLFVLDANTNCITAKDFPCPTHVTVYLVRPGFTDVTHLPTQADYFTRQDYPIQTANGDNFVVFPNPLPDNTAFRIYLDFKTADNSNCTSPNTKFVLDDFFLWHLRCANNCAPVASDDYFDGGRQGFLNVLKANVYGGYLLWSSNVRTGYETRSLSFAPAVNNGTDYDFYNRPLSQMQFELISGPAIVSSTGCIGTPSAGTLLFNTDGTFQYTRTSVCVQRVQFQYRIIAPDNMVSNTATVTIDFAPPIILPVSLYSFTAQRNRNNVILKWQTASERNCAGFYVQCNSGQGWSNQAFVFSLAENGNSNSMLTYQFTDLNIAKGITQYRLAQKDLEGYLTYSAIRSVANEEAAGTILVVPNPVTSGSATVILPDPMARYELLLFDAQGKRIRTLENVTGNNISFDQLGTGIYLLRVNNLAAGTTSVTKLVVIK